MSKTLERAMHRSLSISMAAPGLAPNDFVQQQGGRLAKTVRLIAFDQRGVLRSAPLSHERPLHLDDLIEDTEALRRALGIRRWTLLGHSFGGHIALLYALRYPASTSDEVTRFVRQVASH
jgi:proline iminopeptidase